MGNLEKYDFDAIFQKFDSKSYFYKIFLKKSDVKCQFNDHFVRLVEKGPLIKITWQQFDKVFHSIWHI